MPDVIAAVPLVGVATDVTERVVPESSATTTASSAVVVAWFGVGASFPYEVGVTVTASLTELVPTLFVARIRKLYSASLVSPVTV